MYIKRDKYLEKLIRYKDKDIVKIITGVRRCGKSVLLNSIYRDYLLNNGVLKDNIISISFDLKKWEKLKNPDKLYNFFVKSIKNDSKYYIILDEIQLVKGFEEVVNSIKNEFNTDIYITGSNSHLLSSDINTIFRGRGIDIKVFPFSFKEYYDYKGIDKQEAFNEYVMFGGLPYVVLEENNNDKASYLKMICDTVVYRDIVERYDIKNEELFSALINLLCSSIGNYVSANKIANTLISNGFKTIDNETITRYLNHICDAFLFYKVDRFDIKGKEYLKTQNKYYVCDLGIRNSKINFRQTEMTHIIENIVYLDLIRRGYIVDIGKNRDKEIDFVAKDLMGKQYYIQVSYTLVNQKTKEREVAAFSRLDDGYKKIVINMDNNPFTNLGNGYISLNLFDFLLYDNILETI
ncbi:MAG: ATP-binding protein [Candidatus Riflebacteria bacterium]|nr:ATP-binding protein [Candidatus Riflebacteria bacterium]